MKTRTTAMTISTGTRDSKIQDGEDVDFMRSPGPHTLRVAPNCIMNGFQHKWYFIFNFFHFSKKFFHKPQVFQQHIPNNQNKDHPNSPRWPWLSRPTSNQFQSLWNFQWPFFTSKDRTNCPDNHGLFLVLESFGSILVSFQTFSAT